MPAHDNTRIGRFIVATGGGETVRVYVPPPLPSAPPVRLDSVQLLLTGKSSPGATGRTCVISSGPQPLYLRLCPQRGAVVLSDRGHAVIPFRSPAFRERGSSRRSHRRRAGRFQLRRRSFSRP